MFQQPKQIPFNASVHFYHHSRIHCLVAQSLSASQPPSYHDINITVPIVVSWMCPTSYEGRLFMFVVVATRKRLPDTLKNTHSSFQNHIMTFLVSQY